MDCVLCGNPLEVMSVRQHRKASEIEETQLFCKSCRHYVVINKDLQTWYDENDRPIHPTHDK